MKLTKLNPRFDAAPIDDDRAHGLLALNTVGGTALPISGFSLGAGTVAALATAIVDGSGTQITSFGGGTQYVDGDAAATHPTGTGIIYNNAGTYTFVSAANPLPVSATFSPSGTQDVNLTKVGGTSFALGQQLAAASLPVVLTAAQISTLTPLSTVAVTQSTSPWVVNTASATGSAVPANAFYVAARGASSNLVGLVTAGIATNSTTNDTILATGAYLNNGSSWDRPLSITNGTNSTGTGIQAVGNVAQFDDVAPTSITENQFGNMRISANRNLYTTIRDAAGNERGLNVDASGNIAVTQSGNWTARIVGNAGVALDAATGSAIPANALLTGLSDGTNIVAARQAVNALNSSSGGLQGVALAAQFDDVSPTSITENNFGNIRISQNRNLYSTIRDAAGNERGVNVNASNQMSVSVDNIASGTNIIGKVGIDQTTIGTTNNVSISASTGAGTSTLIKDDTAFGDGVTSGIASVALRYYNGTNYDRVKSTAGLPTTEVAPTTIFNGKKTVTTAGTRVTLASTTAVKSVTIKALAANTGTIYVGNATVASTNGFALAAGDTVSLDVSDLATVNIDSSVNGEGVTYIAVV